MNALTKEMTKAILFASFLALASAACSPQVIYMKQREVDRTVPPPDGVEVDHFLYQVATGSVNVVFIVDDTDSAFTWAPVQASGQSPFEARYQAFLNRLQSDPALHQVDYHVQVVTTPGVEASGQYITPGSDPTQQLSDLFAGANPIFNPQPASANPSEQYPLNPVASTASALARKEFTGRANIPLFLVYALGSDVNATGIQTGISTDFGSFQTLVTAITDQSPVAGATLCDPNYVQPAPTFVASLSGMNLAQSPTLLNLCDPAWGGFEAGLESQIVSFMSKIVLKQLPYEAALMTVKSGTRQYVYGVEYTYDSNLNTISFVGDPGLQPGDLITVSYFTMPPSTNPLPVPVPSSTP